MLSTSDTVQSCRQPRFTAKQIFKCDCCWKVWWLRTVLFFEKWITFWLQHNCSCVSGLSRKDQNTYSGHRAHRYPFRYLLLVRWALVWSGIRTLESSIHCVVAHRLSVGSLQLFDAYGMWYKALVWLKILLCLLVCSHLPRYTCVVVGVGYPFLYFSYFCCWPSWSNTA